MNKKEIIKEIEILTKEIELERKINEYSGNLSFMEYQLNELKKDLESLNNESKK